MKTAKDLNVKYNSKSLGSTHEASNLTFLKQSPNCSPFQIYILNTRPAPVCSWGKESWIELRSHKLLSETVQPTIFYVTVQNIMLHTFATPNKSVDKSMRFSELNPLSSEGLGGWLRVRLCFRRLLKLRFFVLFVGAPWSEWLLPISLLRSSGQIPKQNSGPMSSRFLNKCSAQRFTQSYRKSRSTMPFRATHAIKRSPAISSRLHEAKTVFGPDV